MILNLHLSHIPDTGVLLLGLVLIQQQHYSDMQHMGYTWRLLPSDF